MGGLQRHARENPAVLQQGHEMLIQDYFKRVARRPVRLLDTSDVAFGACLGRTAGLPYEERGLWNMPAFVHRSSTSNECFDLDRTAQQGTVDGVQVNVCHFHPLGAWWRSLFCSAVRILEIRESRAAEFCDDAAWYSTGPG